MNILQSDKDNADRVNVGEENGGEENDEDCLMKALLSWSANRQKEYLKGKKLPHSDNKAVLAKQISLSLEKECAIDIVKEFETKITEGNMKKRKASDRNLAGSGKRNKTNAEKRGCYSRKTVSNFPDSVSGHFITRK